MHKGNNDFPKGQITNAPGLFEVLEIKVIGNNGFKKRRKGIKTMMMKKLFAGILAAAMVFSMTTTAFADKETDSGKKGAASIEITLPTDSAGTDAEITYTVYKVFNATSDGETDAIAYTIDAVNGDLSPAMTTAGFSVDDAGNVKFDKNKSMATDGKPTDAAIAAVAAYAKDSVGTFTAKPSDGKLKITGLEYGYYYITTTTGSCVTIDSTTPNAQVKDKNTLPTPPDKKITGVGTGSYDQAGQNAIAQVGTDVTFTATITKVAGAQNYVYHDTMSDGLEYNGDVKVTVPEGSATPVYDKTPASGETITLTFDNDWLAGLADDTVITITYTAKVTSDALNDDPANNTASLSYGNNNMTTSDKVNIYNAKFTVTKSDGDGKALAGAGFIIQSAGGGYYNLEDGAVTWVATSDEATEYTSDASGAVKAFTGLANGTYTLIEKTVPAGYNKAADQDFEIKEGDYTAANLQLSANVVNESGTELPSTGGIGTTLFYIVGAILALGAGVLLVARRRMSNI